MVTAKSLLVRFFQILETAFLASLVAGLVVGILARAAMTALTLAGGRSDNFAPLTFSVAGTITIITLSMLGGIPMAVLLVVFWRFLPGSTWIKPLLAGLITLAFPGLVLLTDSSFKLNDANLYYGLTLFAALYFGYGLLVGFVIETLNKRAASPKLTANNSWLLWKRIILPALFVSLVIVYRWADAISFGR